MKHTAKKVLKTGFAFGLLTLEEAKKVAKKVKKELDLNEEESMKLAKQLAKSSKQASEDVLKKVGNHFESAIVKSGLAKKSELKVVKNVLKRRVDRAMKEAGKKVKTKAAPKKKAKKRKAPPQKRKKK